MKIRDVMIAIMMPLLVSSACGNAERFPIDGVTPTPWPTPYPTTAGIDSYVLVHQWYQADPGSCAVTTNPNDRTKAWHTAHWKHWQWKGENDICTTAPGAPWLRMIPSNAYPAIGPYDSRDPEVRRHQMRQMKAAGFKGAFVPTYTFWNDVAYMFDLFWGNEAGGITGSLQIAHEEGFKLGIEFWHVSDRGDAEQALWRSEMARHVAKMREIELSPLRDAYLHISGKPAVWLFDPSNPAWEGAWMTRAEALEFFDGAENDPRFVTWILRCASVDTGIEFNKLLKHATVQAPVGINFPGLDGFHRGVTPEQEVSELEKTRGAGALGMIPAVCLYTGYDERVGGPSGYVGRYGLRKNANGTSVIAELLEEAKTAGTKIVFAESWNEWGEGSEIEPGVNIVPWRAEGQEPDLYTDQSGDPDPYLYLKIFQRFHGMRAWVPPPPPPCSIVDPLMRLSVPSVPCIG